jgi:hypothetical protein
VFQILLVAPEIDAAERIAKKEAGGSCQLQAAFVEASHPAERDRKSLDLARKRLQMAKDPLETFHAQVHFVRMANNVQQLSDAKPIAETILKTAPKFKSNWDYGNGVHIAHIVLGRYAASTGDVATAKYHLNAAAFPAASSILREFGPNLSLARALLKRGECDAVLAFLSKYAKIWRTEDAPQKFSEWEKDIKSGKFPRFGANLVY